MKHIIPIVFICAASTMLASCEKQVPGHSVEYFKQHAAERSTVLTNCKAKPDLFKTDANCRAAADAEALSGSFTPSKPKVW